MNLKAMATVSLAGLAVAAAGCGGPAYLPVATNVRYASDGTLVVFAGSEIDSYGPDLTRKAHIPIVSADGALFSLSDDGSVAAVGSSQVAGRVGLLDLSGSRGPTMTALGQSPAGPYGYAPQGLTLSPHGDLLFVVAGVGGQDTSGMFDMSTGARLWTIEAAYGVRAFFSPDESTLYVLGASPVYGGGLQGFDSRTGKIGLNAPLADSVQAFGGIPPGYAHWRGRVAVS